MSFSGKTELSGRKKEIVFKAFYVSLTNPIARIFNRESFHSRLWDFLRFQILKFTFFCGKTGLSGRTKQIALKAFYFPLTNSIARMLNRESFHSRLWDLLRFQILISTFLCGKTGLSGRIKQIVFKAFYVPLINPIAWTFNTASKQSDE